MAEKYEYDLFVIGAGSGGVRASRVAASLGARVAIAEERYLGGTCVNVGCIPKKLLVYASEFSEAFEDSAGFGWTSGECRFDWNKLVANKNVEIARRNNVYENLLINAGVRILRNRARVVDAHTIAIGGERVTTKYILVATGGWTDSPANGPPAVRTSGGLRYAVVYKQHFLGLRLCGHSVGSEGRIER